MTSTDAPNLAPRPALDPADWRLSYLATYHQRDLLDPGSPWATIPRIGTVDAPGTWIQAELIPLTAKAIDSIPLLTGHRFTCQGQLFEVTGGYVTQGSGSESPVLVSITCEQIHDAQEQPVFPPLMLSTTTPPQTDDNH